MEIDYWTAGSPCCSERWEAAYARFESSEEEVEKFRRRLLALGAAEWPRDLRIADLFCGSGSNLIALAQLGFTDLDGVDLSPDLLGRYQGQARLHVGDCTALRFPDDSRDVIIVQGGLHHLPRLPEDLEAVVAEIRRVLRPGGLFVAVEPWSTPFLEIVHAACRIPLLTACWPRLNALGIMIEEEEQTYRNWLGRPEEVREILTEGFEIEILRVRWGKLLLRARLP